MTRKPLILVDCDGVLASFVDLYKDLQGILNARSFEYSDVTEFDFTKCVSTPEEDAKIWRHISTTPGLIDDLAPEDGALAGLDELRSFARVVCVTSPADTTYWCSERVNWLKKVCGFDKRDIIFASAKELIPGDALIDDKLDQVVTWDNAHINGAGIVFDQPWNRKPGAIWRAHSWAEVVSIVKAEVLL